MKRGQLKFWLAASGALVAAMLLRIWFVTHLAHIAGDSLVYGNIAKTWLLHGVYGFTENGATLGSIQFRPTLIRLPGYPIFLAACFRLFGVENYNAVLYMQVAADLLTCCLVAALAGRLFGRRSALVVLWIAALCPFTANYVAMPLTETLVLTTIALTFYGFMRWLQAGLGYNRWLWVIAAALSYSILLRPDQGLLAAAALPAMLYRSLATRERRACPLRSALPVLVAALCVMLPLIPWTLRNERTFHLVQPLAPYYANDPGEVPPLGFARWYRTWDIDYVSNEQVYWNLNGNRIELSAIPARAFAGVTPSETVDLHQRTGALLADYNATTTYSPNLDTRFVALARERTSDHPLLCHVGLPVARLLDMALRPRTEAMPISNEWWRWNDHPAQSAFAAAYAALNLAFFVLSVAGFSAWKRRARLLPESVAHDFRALAIAMVGYILLRAALLLTIDNSEPRYTLEFFPILYLWIGALFAVSSIVVPEAE
jgi:4-amino-4-deoxy-L-arabinose transferase-like glycosyltransferase